MREQPLISADSHVVEPADLWSTRLEKAYGLDEAIVVPAAETADGTAKGVGLALGQFLTETIRDDCTIGVG